MSFQIKPPQRNTPLRRFCVVSLLDYNSEFFDVISENFDKMIEEFDKNQNVAEK